MLKPPADVKFGDATCNAAMRLAKQLKKAPRAIAEELARDLEKAGLPHLARVDIAGAGFVNLTARPESIRRRPGASSRRGRSTGARVGAGRRVLVEHCSANPTGPLHIAHGRQAAVGDSLANLLDFAGFAVSREFYINDTGHQIEMLGKSILWRLGSDPNPPDENAYRGEYIKTLAEELRAQGGPVDLERAMRYGKDRLLEEIRKGVPSSGSATTPGRARRPSTGAARWTRSSIISRARA